MGTSHELDEPIEIAGRKFRFFGVKSSSHDPSLAPEGKSVIGCGGPTDWSYWEKRSQDGSAYEAAKDRLVAQCLQQLELCHPGFGARSK